MLRIGRYVLFAGVAFLCLFGEATAAETTDTPARPSNVPPPKLDFLKAFEEIAFQDKVRFKWTILPDGNNIPCPRLTSFIHAHDDRFRIVMINRAVDELNGTFNWTIGTPNIVFSNPKCRLALSIRKFALRNGVETEIDLRRPSESAELAALLRKMTKEGRPIKQSVPDSNKAANGVEVRRGAQGDEAFIPNSYSDPDRIGMTELGMTFKHPESDLTFSGIMWFGPKNFSFYLANVSKEFSISSRKNAATKAYDVDIGNQTVRMRFSMRKEVLVDGIWITEFAE